MLRIGGTLPTGQAIIPAIIGSMEDSLKKDIQERGYSYALAPVPSKKFDEGYRLQAYMVINPEDQEQSFGNTAQDSAIQEYLEKGTLKNSQVTLKPIVKGEVTVKKKILIPRRRIEPVKIPA